MSPPVIFPTILTCFPSWIGLSALACRRLRQFVNALTKDRLLLGHEVGPHVLFLGRPALATIVAAIRAGSGDGDLDSVGVLWVDQNRVHHEPTDARLPVLAGGSLQNRNRPSSVRRSLLLRASGRTCRVVALRRGANRNRGGGCRHRPALEFRVSHVPSYCFYGALSSS